MIHHQGRDLDEIVLVRIASTGVQAKVKGSQLRLVSQHPYKSVVVALNGEHYDVLAGAENLPDGYEKHGALPVVLLSKMLLKKIGEVTAVPKVFIEPPARPAPVDDRPPRREVYQSDQGYNRSRSWRDEPQSSGYNQAGGFDRPTPRPDNAQPFNPRLGDALRGAMAPRPQAVTPSSNVTSADESIGKTIARSSLLTPQSPR